MLKSIAGVLILCTALGGTAIGAPLSGVDVDFYPNQSALDVAGVSADTAANDDTLNLQIVADSDLKTMSGGIGIVGDVQLNNAANSSAGSTNNVSGNVTTGTINSPNVANLSGFNTILLNTGNNVSMQTITQVNIILK